MMMVAHEAVSEELPQEENLSKIGCWKESRERGLPWGLLALGT